jgi:branched-chain amino acid transport system substrate-binding protein
MRISAYILAGISCVLLLWVIASCQPTAEKTEQPAATKAVHKTETPKTPAAELSGEYKIGFNYEETGNAATFGVSSHKGSELALKEINEGGMLGGLKLVSVFEDNESRSEKAAQVASKLINQDKVDAVIGAVASSNSIATARIVEDAAVPMISPSSTNPMLTLNDDGTVKQWVFRACFTDDFQGDGIVDFAVNGLKAKRAAVLYDADNDYSVGIWKRIQDTAEAKGLEVVSHDSFLSSSETDFRSKLNKFKSTPFDVLIAPIYYNQAALIARQAREVGLTQPILGGDGLDSEDLWKIAGRDVEETTYFTNHYSPDDPDPKIKDFIAKYKQAYAAVPDALAVLAYDAVYLLADAIKRAGSTDKAAVRQALESTKGFQGVSGTFDIDAKHDPFKKLVVIRIGKGGSKMMVYAFDPINPENSGPVGGWTPAPPSSE